MPDSITLDEAYKKDFNIAIAVGQNNGHYPISIFIDADRRIDDKNSHKREYYVVDRVILRPAKLFEVDGKPQSFSISRKQAEYLYKGLQRILDK